MTDLLPDPARTMSAAEIHALRRLAQLLRRLPPGTTIGSALTAGLISDARLAWALRPMGDVAAARQWLGLPACDAAPEQTDA